MLCYGFLVENTMDAQKAITNKSPVVDNVLKSVLYALEQSLWV